MPIKTEWGSIEEIERDSAHTLARITVFPQGVVPAHFHRETRETYVGVKGSGVVVLDGIGRTLSPSSTLEIPPGTIHETLNTGTDTDDLVFLARCRPPYSPDDDYST